MFDKKYKAETDLLWGSHSDEVCFARQRLEKQGVEPHDRENYKAKHNLCSEHYEKAIEQATEHNKKVAVYFDSGVLKGLYVVSPNEKRDFDYLCKNQVRFREDKPIAQQMALMGRRLGNSK